QAHQAALAAKSRVDARAGRRPGSTPPRLHDLPQSVQDHEGHLSTAGREQRAPSRAVPGGRPPPPTQKQRCYFFFFLAFFFIERLTSSRSEIHRVVDPSYFFFFFVAFFFANCVTSFRRSLSSPWLHGVDARPARARAARNARGRRRAAAGTRL